MENSINERTQTMSISSTKMAREVEKLFNPFFEKVFLGDSAGVFHPGYVGGIRRNIYVGKYI
jgi:hypothetical protein